MSLYVIGMIITLGALCEAKAFDEKGFWNKASILVALIIWPFLWGSVMYDVLKKNGAIK